MNEDILKKMGFQKSVEDVKEGHCPCCQKEIHQEDFRNEISRKEFKISGLCQECQDQVFGVD
jgi:hypothetical protein